MGLSARQKYTLRYVDILQLPGTIGCHGVVLGVLHAVVGMALLRWRSWKGGR